mmetsp:Transcript_25325/g.58850  ORF Transcript_25325/g.58850 Transcript_25325/m.58850 type:complete len:219 (-) Transcript_25325:1241-1897(-)
MKKSKLPCTPPMRPSIWNIVPMVIAPEKYEGAKMRNGRIVLVRPYADVNAERLRLLLAANHVAALTVSKYSMGRMLSEGSLSSENNRRRIRAVRKSASERCRAAFRLARGCPTTCVSKLVTKDRPRHTCQMCGEGDSCTNAGKKTASRIADSVAPQRRLREWLGKRPVSSAIRWSTLSSPPSAIEDKPLLHDALCLTSEPMKSFVTSSRHLRSQIIVK